MLGINGIVGLPEGTSSTQASDRSRRLETQAPGTRDDVAISPEARDAAKIISMLRESEQSAQIRQERVEQAKQNIEQGAYKVVDVVKIVASRIAPTV
jgi:anti-sigma28 factor (negative regulator of flagellin synthesis)